MILRAQKVVGAVSRRMVRGTLEPRRSKIGGNLENSVQHSVFAASIVRVHDGLLELQSPEVRR